MELYKSSANFGHMPDATISATHTNAICGDKMVLQLKLEAGTVLDAKFTGVSCAVSKTSASILTEAIKGKSIPAVQKLTDQDILKLLNFELTSSRQHCALLCYYALQTALQDYDQTLSTNK